MLIVLNDEYICFYQITLNKNKMKKIILSLTVAFITLGVIAQEKSNVNTQKLFLILSGGPSLPVGSFSSKDLASNTKSGLATIGYNINLNSGYHITDRFGIASTVFYSLHKIDQDALNKFQVLNSVVSTTKSVDHWQYFGIVIGPMATFKLMDQLFLDIKGMAGFARANLPSVKEEIVETGVIINSSSDRWTDAFAIQLGSNLRYNFASRVCLFTNVDYGFMNPKWTSSGSEDIKQEMGVINFNVGAGIRF